MSPCLWQSLDLRAHKCEETTTSSLASRCENLQKLRFRGDESAAAILSLNARGLREISGAQSGEITNTTLIVIAARHGALEILQLGPFCARISSIGIKAIAICCPNLRKLRLSGIRDVDGDAINALAKHCRNLIEIGFVDCHNVDETALGNVVSLRSLSVAGAKRMNWGLVSEYWTKLPNLIGLDVSRTNITRSVVWMLLSSSASLKVLCALHCPALEEGDRDSTDGYPRGKLVISFVTDIFKELASLVGDVNEIVTWVEWILSCSLLWLAQRSIHGLDNFWLSQGTQLLLNLMQSSQEDVQERATMALGSFVFIGIDNARIDGGRAQAVMRSSGIRLLFNFARSWREGLQLEATKAITNLSLNADAAKAVVEEGGIKILSTLASSMSRSVAEEAAGGLWNLSFAEEHKKFIAEDGGVKALVDLIFRWYTNGNRALELAAGVLANIAADDKLSMVVAEAGGLRALVMLAQNCKLVRVQKQVARALANLASHVDANFTKAAVEVGQEAGALEVLVELTCSAYEDVSLEAAGALWNLSFDDDRIPEAIAAAGGVEALVYLAQSCSNGSRDLKERAAGALWGLSLSEENSIAIGQRGGVTPLIALVHSASQSVHETAAGALWNLAFNPGNALRIVKERGVPALVQVCSCSESKVARFMAALAMANMFDGRMDEVEGTSRNIAIQMDKRYSLKTIKSFLRSFFDPQTFATAAASSSLAALRQVAQSSHIWEAGHLRCSGTVIGRFVAMLRNLCSTIKACATFALVQFTARGSRHALHHVALLRDVGAPRVLRGVAAAKTAPLDVKVFARIVLRNLE